MVEILYKTKEVKEIQKKEALIFNYEVELPESIFKKKYKYYNFHYYDFFTSELFLNQFNNFDLNFIISSGIKSNEIYQNHKLLFDLKDIKVKFKSVNDGFSEIINYDYYHHLSIAADKIYIFSEDFSTAIYCDRYFDLTIIATDFPIEFKNGNPKSYILDNINKVLDLSTFCKNYDVSS